MGQEAPSPDLLDRALAGRPAEVRARVLDLVYRLELDAEDPLFLVMIGFGTLEALLEDSPKQLQQTFEEFLTEVEAWSNLHLETLESIARKAETEEMLANSCKELVSSLANLTSTCNALMTRLQSMPPTSSNWDSTWRHSDKISVEIATLIRQDLLRQGEHLHRAILSLDRRLIETRRAVRRWVLFSFWAQIGVIAGVVLAARFLH